MPEDEEVVPKDTFEWVKHHGMKAAWNTLHFMQTQPIVTLIIGLIFIYLLAINRKLDRLEHTLGQLIELHKQQSQEQSPVATTTINQTTLEQIQDI